MTEWKSARWSEVSEGDEVPAVSMPLTITRLVIAAGGERDFNLIHHDVEAIKGTGNRTVFACTNHQIAFLNRVVDDWMGPEGTLKRLQISMRSPAYMGTTMTGKGKVVKKYQEDGQNLVDLELSVETDDGPTTTSSATVSLPA